MKLDRMKLFELKVHISMMPNALQEIRNNKSNPLEQEWLIASLIEQLKYVCCSLDELTKE